MDGFAPMELLEHDKKGLLLAMKMALTLGDQSSFEQAYLKYVTICKQIRERRISTEGDGQ
jgi:hypothetical protein